MVLSLFYKEKTPLFFEKNSGVFKTFLIDTDQNGITLQ